VPSEGLAREMASKRLVTLEADPTDKRVVLAKPTERGRAFLQDACAVRAELEAEFLGKLSAAKQKEWVGALRAMTGG
jgi:DNA-binding MarR family transcriptional regulator